MFSLLYLLPAGDVVKYGRKSISSSSLPPTKCVLRDMAENMIII